MDNVKILIKEPNKEPYEAIVKNDLKTFQNIVGGFIYCIEMPNIKNVDIFCNEEGKLRKLDANFFIPEYQDVIVGTCYFIGYNDKDGEFLSLTNKKIDKIKDYLKYKKIPDNFDVYENGIEPLLNLANKEADK